MDYSKMKHESLMMSYGYKPNLSEGSIKCPIFQTSTFVFKNAEEGKAFFEVAYGHREKEASEELGLIYSRLNNPDLEILENRLTLWDKAEDCAVFESGMSAISTVFLECLKPGDLLLFAFFVFVCFWSGADLPTPPHVRCVRHLPLHVRRGACR